MALFFQRKQVERDGARQLLNGIATQFEVMTYFTALYGSKSIEEVGRELAAALRETLAEQTRQTEEARRLADAWQQKFQIQLNENTRQRQEQTALAQRAREMGVSFSSAYGQLEQARATAIQLEVSLNRERAGRAGDVTRLESKVADLNRIVAAQQLEILKLRGEPIGDEEVSDERADLNQEHP